MDTSPPRTLRQRWQRWWLQRLPRSDTHRLTHRNLYILPTRAGLMLGVTLLLLLVGSINYQLNLGYLLTFLLTGCGAVAIHVAHHNLLGLQLSLAALGPVFAGSAAAVDVTLHNPHRRARYGLALRWATWDHQPAAPSEVAWADVPGQDSCTVRLGCPTLQRGRQTLPAVWVESRFPIGTFRVWSWWRPAATVIVYPAPETPAPALPLGGKDDGTAPPLHPGRGDELDHLRPWRRGDPFKWVVWKKAARQPDLGQWVSRDWNAPPTNQLWLDAARCGQAEREGQLSRLCAWVLEAEKQGLSYGLQLPGQTIPLGQGAAHQQRCLEALALC